MSTSHREPKSSLLPENVAAVMAGAATSAPVLADRRQIIATVEAFFARQPEVKFAYLFGSVANCTQGVLSDVDLAVCLDGRRDLFNCRLLLQDALAKSLHHERFDLVVLNNAPLVLKYEVVKNGIVLKEDRPRRIMFETAVLQEYLDTGYLRSVHYRSMREQLREGRYFG